MSICSSCAARLSYPPLSPLPPSTDSLPCFRPLWFPIFVPAAHPRLCPGKAEGMGELILNMDHSPSLTCGVTQDGENESGGRNEW